MKKGEKGRRGKGEKGRWGKGRRKKKGSGEDENCYDSHHP